MLYDGVAPDNVMITWFGDLARVSTVVGSAPEDPVFDLPTYAMRMADPFGRLRLINLVGTVSDIKTRDRACVHRVNAQGVTRGGPLRVVGRWQAAGTDQLLHLRLRLPRHHDAGR